MSCFYERASNLLEYFGVRSKSYYHSQPAVSCDPEDPLAYYLDQTRRAAYNGPLDESGVPLYGYGNEGGLTYLPAHIIPYALGHLELYRQRQCDENMHKFQVCVDWLEENQQEDGSWTTNLPMKKFGLTDPFKSAMAQGLGISCLVRAAQLLDNPCYLDCATRALRPFQRTVDEGGVTTLHKEGPFYEEYPCIPSQHVLNGFLFALWGLHDMARIEHTAEARTLWDDGISTLIKWLPQWDIGYWSLYSIPDRPRNPATVPYHQLHIKQMRVMHTLTGENIFSNYAEHWQDCMAGRFNALRTLPAKLWWLIRTA